jgi:hypothetical protein
MTVESFRGFAATIVAGIGFLGSIIGAAWAWVQPITEGSNPRDLAIIFGVFTGVIGVTGTFLFVQESASRASRASERANAAGVVTGRRTE